ncbi:MAG: hypothetical protein K1X85_03020 [Ignavibacteria bacterium]|nr:hypothetical protein [Ignavibacteria bacterium]
MILKLEHTPKIVAPQVTSYYFSRERLLHKITSQKDKRLILVTAPAGYGKTSLAVEFFHKLRSELKLWISISRYDNSLENFFLLFAMAFRKYLKPGSVGENLRKVLTRSQNMHSEEKVNLIISSFSSDLYSFLKKNNKELFIFLDDFHNIDDSLEVCEALNYFFDYLPENIRFVIITRKDPKLLNYPKFMAKGWMGRITRSDLSFDEEDLQNLLKAYKKRVRSVDSKLLKEYIKGTEGWITAIQLLLMSGHTEPLTGEDLIRNRADVFDYFANEIYSHCTEEEKKLLLALSYAESFDKKITEDVLSIKNGYETLLSLHEKNLFINREVDEFRFHELFQKFLNNQAKENISAEEEKNILSCLGRHYLSGGEWREEFIGVNYLIRAGDYEELRKWIKYNASDKLLLIHSSGLYDRISNIDDKEFSSSLEYILLKVNTLVYKDKEIDKAIEYLEGLLRSRFGLSMEVDYLMPHGKIPKKELNYYVEVLMLICNCNFLKEGISHRNIEISEHLLRFNLRIEQEIQFIVSLVKSYITTGENAKSRKHIERLKRIFTGLQTGELDLKKDSDENTFVESVFSMLIFFDYGDFKCGNDVVNFITNNCNRKSFDLSNYSQACFALFASYNRRDFEKFYAMLGSKHKEKKKTMFSAYKNQYEFQTILRKFLHFEFEETIRELEAVRKNTFLKNYVFFIDSLILYSYCLLNHPRAVMRHLDSGKYSVSKTRELILRLEAALLLGDFKEYERQMKRVEEIGRENFTVFNQAVITFYECFCHSLKNDRAKFKERYLKFLSICKEYHYDNYVIFRANSNRLRSVFEYAAVNGISSEYASSLPGVIPLVENSSERRKLTFEVKYLKHNRIYINGKELTDNLWLRPKSKMIFLYCIYKASVNDDITKEKIIDDILYKAKDVNYEAIVDVEINKVRKTLQRFVSELISDDVGKEFMILKDKKYQICSKNFDLEIQTDTEEFKRLAAGSTNDKLKAVEMYESDFIKDSYRNWAEDVRENLKFIYSDVIHKLITHYENRNENEIVIRLLERLLELDFTDEEIMMKLLSLYNREKDYRKFKYAYGLYEKRLKKEFNVQPSNELKEFFNEVTMQS